MGRRMVDTAARLIDEVLPPVPVRQWVLSLPFEIRYRLAWDGKLVSAVLAVFLRVVYGWYRRQAKGQGHDDGRCGSVSFVQRFGSALNLPSMFPRESPRFRRRTRDLCRCRWIELTQTCPENSPCRAAVTRYG